jgi:hypothetical protein
MSENTGSAAEAFEALREEVAKLRNGIEWIYKQGREIKTAAPPKDYDLPLGNIEKRLGAIEINLARMKWEVPLMMELPGERVPPEELVAISKEAKAAALELRKATGHIIGQQTVRWRLVGMFGLGTVIGIMLFIGIASLLPSSAGAWMAASIFGGDPWTAGETLMRQADPVSFERMVELYQACPQDDPVDLCRAAMAVKAATAAGQ